MATNGYPWASGDQLKAVDLNLHVLPAMYLGDGADGSATLDGTSDTTILGHRALAYSMGASPTNGQTITVNFPAGTITFTAVSAIGATPGNFLISGSETKSIFDILIDLLQNPSSTTTQHVGFSGANLAIVQSALWIRTGDTAFKVIAGAGSTSTFTGSTTIGSSSFTQDANSYALSRDIFCTNLTINSGITLYTGGYKIFCTGTFSNAGNVFNDGQAGRSGDDHNGSPVAAGLTLGGFAGSMAGGSSGGQGKQLGSVAGGSPAHSLGGNGGAGGSDSFAAGAGGTATAALTPLKLRSSLLMIDIAAAVIASYTGGAGGGGGGGHNGSVNPTGGWGGGGGGLIWIAAAIITNSGIISANGGQGGVGQSDSGVAGGGGGGGGGAVILVYVSTSNTGTIRANGGTSAGSGSTGSNGTIYSIQV